MVRDPWAEWLRRHRLSVAEAGELEHGVGRGREFSDSRLRAAAVDRAGMQLGAYEPGRGGGSPSASMWSSSSR